MSLTGQSKFQLLSPAVASFKSSTKKADIKTGLSVMRYTRGIVCERNQEGVMKQHDIGVSWHQASLQVGHQLRCKGRLVGSISYEDSSKGSQ